MSTYNTQKPCIASLVLIEKGNKIAFILRDNTSWMSGYYGLPSGKVENNEAFSAGAIREAQEEVGVKIISNNLLPVLVVHRHQEKDLNPDWVDVYFKATKWEGEPYNAEPHMHSELAWLDPNDLPKNVVPSVKFALEQIQAGNSYAEYGW